MLIDVLNHGILAIRSASLAVIDAPEAAQGFACIDVV